MYTTDGSSFFDISVEDLPNSKNIFKLMIVSTKEYKSETSKEKNVVKQKYLNGNKAGGYFHFTLDETFNINKLKGYSECGVMTIDNPFINGSTYKPDKITYVED